MGNLKIKTINGFFDGYAFLNNSYPSKIVIHDKVFTSAEQFIRFSSVGNKLKLTNNTIPDLDTLRKIKVASSSLKISKGELVDTALFLKFTQNSDLYEQLIQTFPALLVNTVIYGDVYWGVTSEGIGKNKLGKALMSLRRTFINHDQRIKDCYIACADFKNPIEDIKRLKNEK